MAATVPTEATGRTALLRWGDGPVDQPLLRAVFHELPVADPGLHRHDFVEAFWVAEGEAVQRTPDGQERIGPGTLFFTRADDRHALCAADARHAAQLWTIAIPQAEERALRRRLGDEIDRWPWDEDGPPCRVDLPIPVAEHLAEAAWSAARPGQRRLELEWIAAALLRIAAPQQATAVVDDAPPAWLASAVQAMSLGPLVAGGVPALLRLCGRSADHVARSTRRHYGCTPTALVNRLRIERAARLLRFRGASIPEAARAVGMPNLGHFYEAFRRRYGTTPARFHRMAI
jgi:AraC family cel operon transcriptional repressor